MRIHVAVLLALAGCAAQEPQVSVAREGRTGDMEHRVEYRRNHQIVFTARRTGHAPDEAVFQDQCRTDAAALAAPEARRLVVNPGMDTERMTQSVRKNFLTGALTCTVTIPILNYAIP